MTAQERGAIAGNVDKLIPLIEERDKDWIADWSNDKQVKYYLNIMPDVRKCFISGDRSHQRLGAIYMSKETAEYLKPIIDKSLERTNAR